MMQAVAGDYGRDPSRSSGAAFENLGKYAVPVSAFAFLCSTSRIGLGLVPSTTELAWLAAGAITAIAILVRPDLYLALARRNALLLAAAFFATLSALWSLTPSLSAYSGTLLVLNTFVGFMIADKIGMKRTVVYVFWYCLLTQAASIVLIMSHAPAAFDEIGNPKGLYLHKNAMALNSGILYFTSFVLLASGPRRLIPAFGVLLALFSILVSRSGTGIVMIFFTTSLLAACTIFALGRGWSLLFCGLCLVIASIFAATILISDYDISSGVLQALGKDSTLTGRTVLWEQALKSFAEYPWLGLGYNSFWNSPFTAASSIWILTGQLLTSFHNVFIDRLVDVGAIGLSLFVAFLLTVLWRSWRRFTIERSAIWAWPFIYVCFITLDSFSEFPIFWNSPLQLLLAIIAASTCGVKLGPFWPETARPQRTA